MMRHSGKKDKIEIKTLECGDAEVVGKKKVMLIFDREYLLYDIKNNCYIEGHVMVDSPDELRHVVQDVGEEGNVDRVTRILDLAHADVTERLYPFTEREISHPVLDDHLRERPVYGIILNVPETFSQTTLNLLGKLIHELLTSTATAEWLSITNPQKAEIWREKGEKLIARINQIKSFRKDRLRIKPHWI